MHRQQARRALDHHVRALAKRLADQRDARRRGRVLLATARTHSAPARVLPAPRPPSISQRPGAAALRGLGGS